MELFEATQVKVPDPLPVSRTGTDLDALRFDNRFVRDLPALEQAGWVQAKAARLLGMTPRQIAYRIQTLNIKVRHI